MYLHPIDLAIIGIYLFAVIGFGIWCGRGQRDMSDYLLGDRNLPWIVVLLSIVATETSAVTFLSIPGVGYSGDLTFLQIAIGYILGRYVVAALLLPAYFQGQLYTAYQVLDLRFGGATKRAASLMFIVMRNLADGLRLFLAAIVLKRILFPGSVVELGTFDSRLAWAVLIMGSVTTFYTVVGGMKAVAWTDFVQFFIYIVGALCAGAVLLDKTPGGLTEILDFAQQHDKLRVINPTLEMTVPYALWAGLIGGAFLTLGSHGTDQLMVQRYLSARSQSQAASAVRWSGWIVLAQFAFFLLLGIGLASFYQGRTFGRTDEVFAAFIVEELPVGVAGLTIAAVFAAALTSSLNSLAAAAVNDFYVPLVRPQADTAFAMKTTRLFTIFFGVVQIAVGIAGQFFTSRVIDSAMSIAGFTMGIVLGLFLLGTLTRRVGQQAALAALLVGLAGMTTLYFTTKIAWPWFAVIGSLTTFAVGLAASYVFPEEGAVAAEASAGSGKELSVANTETDGNS